MGLWGTRRLSVPPPRPISYLQKMGFIPWVLKGKFNQRLIRKGGDRRQGEEQRRETIVQAWGRVSCPLKGYTYQYLWAVLQIQKPPLGRRSILPMNRETPDPLEPEGWWCWLPLISPLINQKNVHKLIPDPHNSPQVRTQSSEGISPLWPPSPAKAVKLFLSISSTTLYPRIDSGLEYGGWIWFHKLFLLFNSWSVAWPRRASQKAQW